MTENLEKILAFNSAFVENREYENFKTTKFPKKKTAILTCMDTRLIELLPAALNIKNGDVKIIKNAGGSISHPFGSVMRSLLVAVYELGVKEILVIGHFDCGTQGLESEKMIDKMLIQGIKQETIDMIRYCGIDLDTWLKGFDNVTSSVQASVQCIKDHPLMPTDISIQGMVIDPETGKLTIID